MQDLCESVQGDFLKRQLSRRSCSRSLTQIHLDVQLGVQDLCNPVQGNFLKMPFEKETFDGAYAIEATCHANKVTSHNQPLSSLASTHLSHSASLFGTHVQLMRTSSVPGPVQYPEAASQWMQTSGIARVWLRDAVCAVQLEEVYGEVFRVLKPGGMFCSYEWVATKEFDPNDPEHVRIIDEINFGNGLPVRVSATLCTIVMLRGLTQYFCRPMT